MFRIETERLYIRKFKAEDWQDMYEYLSDARVVEFEPYEPFSEEQCKIECMERAKSNHYLAVCLKDTNKLIGNLYLSKDDGFNNLEIGYIVNRNFQRKGYAYESVKAMIEYLFKEMNIRRIIAMCDPLNTPSWKLLECLGMMREAHFRKAVYFKKDLDNKPIWKDTYVYALLNESYHDKD